MATIGAAEAQTRLSELLDRVAQGEEVVITRQGRPAARLVPLENANTPRRRKATAAELHAIGERFRAMVKDEFSSSDINDILYDADGLPK